MDEDLVFSEISSRHVFGAIDRFIVRAGDKSQTMSFIRHISGNEASQSAVHVEAKVVGMSF